MARISHRKREQLRCKRNRVRYDGTQMKDRKEGAHSICPYVLEIRESTKQGV